MSRLTSNGCSRGSDGLLTENRSLSAGMLKWFYLCFFNMKSSGPKCLVLWEIQEYVSCPITHYSLTFTFLILAHLLFFSGPKYLLLQYTRAYINWSYFRCFCQTKWKCNLIVRKMIKKKKIHQNKGLSGFKPFEFWADCMESNIRITNIFHMSNNS